MRPQRIVNIAGAATMFVRAVNCVPLARVFRRVRQDKSLVLEHVSTHKTTAIIAAVVEMSAVLASCASQVLVLARRDFRSAVETALIR